MKLLSKDTGAGPRTDVSAPLRDHSMREHLKRLARRCGYHISRAPANRFVAMEESLRGLKARGFRPAVIIDAGANVTVRIKVPPFTDVTFRGTMESTGTRLTGGLFGSGHTGTPVILNKQ